MRLLPFLVLFILGCGGSSEPQSPPPALTGPTAGPDKLHTLRFPDWNQLLAHAEAVMATAETDDAVDETVLGTLLQQVIDADVGYRRRSWPINITASDEQRSQLESVMADIPKAVDAIREEGRRVHLIEAATYSTYVQYDVPNAAWYSELEAALPKKGQVYIIHLGDMAELGDALRSELTRIDQFQAVRMLELFGNDLVGDDLNDVALGTLTNLEVLNLAENQLTGLPGAMALPPNLVWLSLRSNQLTEVPSDLEDHDTLRFVDLSGNPIPRTAVDAFRREHPGILVRF